MGAERVWFCTFGRTLRMLEFIYKQKEPISSFRDLPLFKNSYIPLEDDVSLKYLTRLDSLTYFLFGLVCFDPLLVYEEVTFRTGQTFPCVEEIKKSNHKWSYREFWNLFGAIKANPFESHHKPVVLMNIISITYLQVLNFKRNGTMK
jgi:hypothetical protein